jgi:hypothetical protein
MMQERDLLEQLAQASETWASSRAQTALAVLEQYDGGGLDDMEFQDIMSRIVDERELDREADDLETKALLITAVLGAAELI